MKSAATNTVVTCTTHNLKGTMSPSNVEVFDPEKFLPPFWRTLLGLLILPSFIASFFLFHAEMMVFLYYYTPVTEQNVDLIEFGDTIKSFPRPPVS